jgi:RNA polymerase sigma-70 factor (ECF subfamily)
MVLRRWPLAVVASRSWMGDENVRSNTKAGSQLIDIDSLLEDMRPLLHGYCARVVGSAFDAEDIVQDSMAKAMSSWNASEIRNPRAWVFRIAHNRAIDHLRRTTRFKLEPLDEASVEVSGEASAVAHLEQQEMAVLALSIFMHLSPLQRCAVILKDVFGYSLAEVADMLEISTGGVKSALHRAWHNLGELSNDLDEHQPALPLAGDDARRLNEYVDSFRNRDFDAVRSMLVADVTLDLVGKIKKAGIGQVGRYFSNYAHLRLTSVEAVFVEGRPALWVTEDKLSYPILLGFAEGGSVATIRDFRHVPYLKHLLTPTKFSA